jgi:rhodanese-related sulfurtransferase
MVTEISRDELKQKLDHPKKLVLVDVLSEDEFRELHLPSAINIPVDQLRRLAPEQMPNKDVEVIVYCSVATCQASENAAKELSDLGYSNVRRYVGGKQDWVQAGMPVIRAGELKVA